MHHYSHTTSASKDISLPSPGINTIKIQNRCTKNLPWSKIRILFHSVPYLTQAVCSPGAAAQVLGSGWAPGLPAPWAWGRSWELRPRGLQLTWKLCQLPGPACPRPRSDFDSLLVNRVGEMAKEGRKSHSMARLPRIGGEHIISSAAWRERVV